MRKYAFIIKTQVMSSLQYVFNLVVNYISYFIILFIFFNIWQYIYSDSTNLINGYNLNQMIWYVVITEIIWMTLDGKKLCTQISNDVKSGNITYNINKPYNYIGYILSKHLGDILIKFGVYSILGIFTGFLFLGRFPNLNILNIIAIIIMIFFALMISTLLIAFIGLFSFFIEDSGPFYWVYSKLILVFGTMFPIEFFPNIIQKFLNFSPIYVVSYGPAKLFVDFSWNSAISIIIAQLIYLFISYFLCYLLYKKGVKKINVNGG